MLIDSIRSVLPPTIDLLADAKVADDRDCSVPMPAAGVAIPAELRYVVRSGDKKARGTIGTPGDPSRVLFDGQRLTLHLTDGQRALELPLKVESWSPLRACTCGYEDSTHLLIEING